MQQKHEAQLQALESRKHVPNDRMDAYPATPASLNGSISAINDTLTMLFVTLESLTAVILSEEARVALRTLVNMETPLLTITGDLRSPNHK